MTRTTENPWLARFALATAFASLVLICVGGLVTSHDAGMAVPHWPTSYGHSMFALPFQFWRGGAFFEHTHRLWASLVGLLVVALTRWLNGRAARRPLAIIGLMEVLAGFGIFFLWPNLKATGHFLTGIGGVVLLAAWVWAQNEPAERPLPQLGWLAFALVQFQGLLGGLRVVLFKDQIGIFHAALAQLFFVLLCVIALFTTQWWRKLKRLFPPRPVPRFDGFRAGSEIGAPKLRGLFLAATALIFLQLIVGATMRHQHAGLAIPDFPTAYGRLWPATDADSIARYNQERVEATGVNPITAFQIVLQMVHRVIAGAIVCLAALGAWLTRGQLRWQNPLSKISLAWFGLIMFQTILGAATIWTGKSANMATAHVACGAVSLMTGAMLILLSLRGLVPVERQARAAGEKTKPSEFAAEPAVVHDVRCRL